MREAIALWEGEIDDQGDLVIDPINGSIDVFSTFVADFEIYATRDLTAVYRPAAVIAWNVECLLVTNGRSSR